MRENGVRYGSGTGMAPSQPTWHWAAGVISICLLPLGLLAIGMDLSSMGPRLMIGDLLGQSQAGLQEAAHNSLRGSFTHTIFEWTALCVAGFIAVLAFTQYRMTRERSLPIIGMALVCAGAMDGFHTLAADRLIDATADNRALIPFTWALCRMFNACILLVGVAIVTTKKQSSSKRGGFQVLLSSFGFAGIAYLVIYLCATSNALPQTMFPESAIKRPYDIVPLIPYAICGLWAFRKLHRQNPTPFTYMLLLSIIPQVATQLYMAFGSFKLHDPCFNIAHNLKVLSYAVPLIGLLLGNIHIYRKQTASETNLREHAETIAQMNEDLEHQQVQLTRARDLVYADNEICRQQAVDLERARKKSEAATQAKSDFLANMSHEIRTPMTSIIGYAENLKEDSLQEDDRKDAVETILRNGNHLLELINNILDLSKIEAGKLSLEQLTCSPIELLSEIAVLMRVPAKAKGLTLDITGEGDIPENICTDPTRLKQILINLVGNAIKFTNIGGIRLLVKVDVGDEEEPKLEIKVVDTGIGMSSDQQGLLFQDFVQADESVTRRFGGTGLGLSISKRLAKMLGGDVVASSQYGLGSTFTLRVATGSLEGVRMLPASEAMVEDARPAERASKELPKIPYRILLAEDGMDNQRLISKILEKAGARVTLADNGRIALDAALASRQSGKGFDIILMDMQMPEMDGYAATKKLRVAKWAGPIIALTAHAMTGDREKCIDAGCSEFATKPVNRRQLITQIHEFMSEGTEPGSD